MDYKTTMTKLQLLGVIEFLCPGIAQEALDEIRNQGYVPPRANPVTRILGSSLSKDITLILESNVPILLSRTGKHSFRTMICEPVRHFANHGELSYEVYTSVREDAERMIAVQEALA
ncbi:MAG: hypothetical protein AABX11_02470 [Nanoarchaeota archaeon]